VLNLWSVVASIADNIALYIREHPMIMTVLFPVVKVRTKSDVPNTKVIGNDVICFVKIQDATFLPRSGVVYAKY
jgi:hypothetical protein